MSVSNARLRSVHAFLWNQEGELLLQRTGSEHRNRDRLGSSVAGFVQEGEDMDAAVVRRVREEVGITPALSRVGTFDVTTSEGSKSVGLYEGAAAGAAVRLPGHIGELLYMTLEEVARRVEDDPEAFTPTFPHVFAAYRRAKEQHSA